MVRFMIGVTLPMIVSAQMSITAHEQVSMELAPDVLRGGLNFEEQHKNAERIKEHLNAIVAEVKRFDPKGEFCYGGGYYLSPRYSYQNQKQEFIGYSGSLHIGCEFRSVEQYNGLLEAIGYVKSSAVKTTEEPLSWGVSEKERLQAQSQMRTQLLQMAQSQAKRFSSELAMECEVASVTIEGSYAPPPYQPMMMKAMMSDSVATESPIQRNEKNSLGANVGYTCRSK